MSSRFNWPLDKSLIFKFQTHLKLTSRELIGISDAVNDLWLLWYFPWNRTDQTKIPWIPQDKHRMHWPCFFGTLENVPFTTLQWELSPPQTPHLSSCFVEPMTLSHPTFCAQRRKTVILIYPRFNSNEPSVQTSKPRLLLQQGNTNCRVFFLEDQPLNRF